MGGFLLLFKQVFKKRFCEARKTASQKDRNRQSKC
nr:MAG TPA_asm: hypothetical protein [Caudoviricetes sp.]